jgi:hypothetical protein
VFGTLKPRGCLASEELKSSHSSYYCGLCQATGQHHGQLLRAVHSHDAVFVAALADGLMETAAAPSSCRCPVVPIRRKATVDPCSPAMIFAAAIQLLLGDQWLADRSVEGGRMAGGLRRLLAGRIAGARSLLAELDVDLSALDGFEHRQAAVERADVGLDEAAAPTAEALALVLGAIAELPGVAGGGAELRTGLEELGRVLGRSVYAIDALEDCGDDARDGSFNPLVVRGLACPERVEQATTRLEADRARLVELADGLPLVRNGALVSELLGRSLAVRARSAMEAGRRASSELGRAGQRRWHGAGASRRLGWIAATLLLSVWSFLVGLPSAFAAKLRPEPEAAGCQCEEAFDGCCDACGDCGEACGGCGDACSKCGDGCGNCGNNCDGCCNNCSFGWPLMRW